MNKNSNHRPTSPHLQIYRWNPSSITSILHRATGVALYFSVLVLSWYLTYYTYEVNNAESAETCDCPSNAIFENLFSLASIAVAFSLYYHLCNGIRHLFWDVGKGFDLKSAKRNSYLVLLSALVLTVATVGVATYLKFF
ncbi:MAG: succinate dehydrogenase, cytochrome b556 subunit [Proteobacteria bacterium]|nr:succinate dehydrogenase, cytochrome b556 subunit [Pseudomonadota bacterium]